MSWIIKQITSKTNISIALAVLFWVLKYFGMIDTVPAEYGLSMTGIAIMNTVIKIAKTIFYKVKK